MKTLIDVCARKVFKHFYVTSKLLRKESGESPEVSGNTGDYDIIDSRISVLTIIIVYNTYDRVNELLIACLSESTSLVYTDIVSPCECVSK